MSKIKAVDGAVCRVNGTPFPVPKGTEINIRVGNDANEVVTGFEQNGDGTRTPLFSKISAGFDGLVFSITTTELEDEFNDLFSKDNHQVVLSNGGIDYSISSAALISPSEEGTPSISSTTRKTESFNVISLSGKIRRSA